MQTRSIVAFNQWLVSYFLCLYSIFHFLLPSRFIFCHYSPHRVLSVRTSEQQQMTLQLLWTDASLLRVSALRSRSSRNMITRWWSGANSSPLLSQMSNTEQSKSGDTMQKSMCVCWSKESLPKVHFCTSLCWNKVFIIYSALWQHSYRSLRLSFTSALPCRPIFTPPYCGIVPYVCIEVFQKDRGLVSFNPLQAITNFSHIFRIQCICVWPYTCMKTWGEFLQLHSQHAHPFSYWDSSMNTAS